MKTMNKTKKSNFSYHRWKWFAYSYLALAEIGIEKLKEKINNPARINNLKDYFVFNKKYLFISIIYNLKHALEIILKGLNIQVDSEYIQTHNSEIISKALQSSIGDKFADKLKINNLAKIVDKYYKINFFEGTLSSKIEILDINNDVFRFPENSARVSLDTECFGGLSKKKLNDFIKELENDTDLLFKLLMDISKDISNSKKLKTI